VIFRISYDSAKIPKDWEMANAVSVHKKGSKMYVKIYRPISLTSPVMKLFEKIIRDELTMRSASKLNTNQHGFLPNKSCTTQLLSFTDSIATALNALIRSDVVYFDFAKAFDSVNHDIILRKINKKRKDSRLMALCLNAWSTTSKIESNA
jgi:hypothetical protein